MTYRRLGPGDRMQIGDEWWDGEQWNPLLCGYNCGHTIPDLNFPPMRRPVAAAFHGAALHVLETMVEVEERDGQRLRRAGH